MILNFVILFAKYYIYNCKKNGMPINFFSFLVKLKSRPIIEEYRHIMYNTGLEFATKWSVLKGYSLSHDQVVLDIRQRC